jgi:hypothetical protein
MKTLIILLNDDINYQLLLTLFSINPRLKRGFTLKELLILPSVSWDEKKKIKAMFGGEYSEIITPEYNFKYRDGKWWVEQIDIKQGVHQFVTKVLNHAVKEGKYPINSRVSTKDSDFLKFLMMQRNDVYKKEMEEFDIEGFAIDQELLEFISHGLNTRLGDTADFNYGFVVAFIESLSDYEKILIRREFGGG